MQPYPRSPDLVWPRHLHGTGCLSARALDTGFPTVVWHVCFGLGCAWARVSAALHHSWLGCCGVCVFVCVLRLYPATPGWGVPCGCVCLGSGFGCAPPLLARVLGCVRVCVRAPLVPRHSLLGSAVCVCVLGLGFRLRPATPGWGVGVCVSVCALRLYPATPGWVLRCWCVCWASGLGCCPPLLAGVLGRACLCARSACTLPLLAGVCGVGVCVWARVSAAPRHSWLGCWGVPVCVRPPLVPCHSWLGWWACVFVCALRLYPATPGWGVQCGCVCLGTSFGCALPLLAGVLGCARLCARSACTPPLLAGTCGVGVCAWARVSAAPRHSLLGCCGVRVCVRAPLVPRHSWLWCAPWVCVFGLVIKPNLVLTEVYFLTLAPMDTEAQALIQILKSILDHRT